MAKTAVRIEILCFDFMTGGSGSGVIIDDRHILTARHVADACNGVADGGIFTAIMYNGMRIPIELDRDSWGPPDFQAGDPHDAARMIVEGSKDEDVGPFETWAKLAKYRPRLGQTVYTLSGGALRLSPFNFKPTYVSKVSKYLILTQGHTVPGNSGSALYDADGNILGLLIAGRWDEEAENVGCVTRPAAWPELFLDLPIDIPNL